MRLSDQEVLSKIAELEQERGKNLLLAEVDLDSAFAEVMLIQAMLMALRWTLGLAEWPPDSREKKKEAVN